MSRRATLALAAGVAAFAAVTTAVGALSGAPLRFLVLDLVTGSSFIVAGLAAAWVRPGSKVGPMLLASGALWFVGSYAPSGQPVVTHLGFAFETYYDLVLAALLLALTSPAARVEPRPLFVAFAGAMAARSLGRLLLTDPVELGCPECPPNPFALWPSVDAFVASEIVTNLAIAALAAVVGLVAIQRLAGAGPVLRRVRWPVLLAGGVAMAAAAFSNLDAAWSTAADAPIISVPAPWDEVAEWLLFGARTLVPIAFLAATLRLRSAAGPLGPLAARLHEGPRTGTVGDALRTTLGDPSVVLLRPVATGGWSDERGHPATLPPTSGDRAVTLVGPDEGPLAAIVHDPGLRDQPELIESVARVLRLAFENERLEAELRDQLQAVRESRQRIITATEAERRRLERDLHDGAQQRLVGVSLALQQARGTADAEVVPDALRAQLEVAAQETAEAIRELRELARGIHPAILEDEGLGPAVAALTRRVGIPVTLALEVDGRLPRLVESTAYFTIAEALTNTQRHARASRATVRVIHTDGQLELEVHDDGLGGAEPARGSGLRGLADRVLAVGGTLEVHSDAGLGTRLRATIPTT